MPGINVDLGAAPAWLVIVVMVGALVAELITGEHQAQGLPVADCLVLCDGNVANWSPYVCVCVP